MTLSFSSATAARRFFCATKGDEKFPNLVTERVFVDDNPPTHEQGTDRPGRAFPSAHAIGHSAVETTDWHEIEKDRFAQRVSAALEDVVRKRAAPALVIAAPPRILADLRHALHPDAKARIVAGIDKDFTKNSRLGHRATHPQVSNLAKAGRIDGLSRSCGRGTPSLRIIKAKRPWCSRCRAAAVVPNRARGNVDARKNRTTDRAALPCFRSAGFRCLEISFDQKCGSSAEDSINGRRSRPPATPAGSATSRSRTTGSATCSRRRATWRRR